MVRHIGTPWLEVEGWSVIRFEYFIFWDCHIKITLITMKRNGKPRFGYVSKFIFSSTFRVRIPEVQKRNYMW